MASYSAKFIWNENLNIEGEKFEDKIKRAVELFKSKFSEYPDFIECYIDDSSEKTPHYVFGYYIIPSRDMRPLTLVMYKQATEN